MTPNSRITLNQAVLILSQGGVVAFPTETVYGLGADATSKKAVERVFEIKDRPKDNPLICHFYSLEQILEYINKINDSSVYLINNFTPGPLSLLLNLKENSPILPATRGKETVIARIPGNPLTLKLIKTLDKPIVGPSANTSGRMSGTNPEMIEKDLGSKIDGVLNGGQCNYGLESTIVDAREEGVIKILRPGKIGSTELSKIFSKKSKVTPKIIKSYTLKNKEVTPGSKYRHYSPKTQLLLSSAYNINRKEHTKKIAVLGFSEDLKKIKKNKFIIQIDLGSALNLEMVAQKLYYNLFILDRYDLESAFLIFPELPESDLAEAIKNRLEKILSKN
jgi:L-threonylcarbamoyladenylate synthase